MTGTRENGLVGKRAKEQAHLGKKQIEKEDTQREGQMNTSITGEEEGGKENRKIGKGGWISTPSPLPRKGRKRRRAY